MRSCELRIQSGMSGFGWIEPIDGAMRTRSSGYRACRSCTALSQPGGSQGMLDTRPVNRTDICRLRSPFHATPSPGETMMP
jgi:hypothetical protein